MHLLVSDVHPPSRLYARMDQHTRQIDEWIMTQHDGACEYSSGNRKIRDEE